MTHLDSSRSRDSHSDEEEEEPHQTLSEAVAGEHERDGDLDAPSQEAHGEGEKSESEAGYSDHSFQSGTNDTIVSQFMKEEYLEWSYTDWSSSHDRAQLSFLMKIYEHGKRQAKAIGDGYDRLADWCAQQCPFHRRYARTGSLNLDLY